MGRFSLICLLLMLSCGVVAQQKVVKLCSYPGWLPYANPDLPAGGLSTEIIKQVFISQGYIVKILWMPWARAMATAKQGLCSGLGEAYYTEQRAQWGSFSNAYFQVNVAFFSLKTHKISYQTLEDLKGLKIGHIRGASVSAKFDAASYLNKSPVNSIDQALRMLDRNRFDLIVDDEAAVKVAIMKLNEKIMALIGV